ncbi:hypothetical protein QQ008_24690 [Fulvivirgaceae bacterium BMA10]|uniref:Uncharacterized protein n=1 Tax=Splendidivirga corallicola TaxID=3051826 RepID=A0ABT8KW42_9BACT|nr:hypothetical protein [Fulvivirgaceae bacterium BMA10]
MTKKFIPLLIFQSLLISLYGQEYPYVDTVNYGNTVSHVYRYFHYDDKPEKLIDSFWFNDEGRHEFTLFGYDYEEQIRTSFEYDHDGALTKVIERSYQSTKNDSLSKIYLEEINQDIEIDWDAIHAKYDSMYEYVNPETVNWQLAKQIPKLIFRRDILSRDSIIEVHRRFHSGESYLAEKVYFLYNEENELIAKKWINIEHPNIIEFNAFKPSVAVFEDSIKLISGSAQAKTYDISKDLIKINYYVNGRFTGYEHQILNIDGLITDEIVFDTKGHTLSHFINTYNDQKLLERRYRKYHSGYNGFSYSLDLLWGNIDKYIYDSLNRLIRIDGFENEKHISTTRFEIFEK